MCSSCRFCFEVYLLLSPRGIMPSRLCDAPPPILFPVRLGERRECGTVEHPAERIEPRAVAGAVPGMLRRVPRDDAAEMRTDGGTTVQHAVGIAVGSDPGQSVPD